MISTEYIAVSEICWKWLLSVTPSAIAPQSEGERKLLKEVRKYYIQSYLTPDRQRNKASRLQSNIVLTAMILISDGRAISPL